MYIKENSMEQAKNIEFRGQCPRFSCFKFSLIYQGFYDTIYEILKRKERILEFSQVEWYAGENLQSTVF